MPSHRQPLNFHRFIHSDDINQISIRIPNKFTREHRKNILLNDILLAISDGMVWSVSLMISGDGKLWLQKGWPEFAEHYGLKNGYFLVFDHQGMSVFHVRIFDRSTCEINYGDSIFREIEEPATEYDQTMAMSEKEVLKLPTLSLEIKEPATEYDQTMAMSEKEVLELPTLSQDIKEPATEYDQTMAMSEKEVLEPLTLSQETKASGKGNDYIRRKRALDSARSFKSNYPFYSVKFKASYVNWGLYVPVPFIRRHLLSGDEMCVDCVLQVPDGSFWGPIKCRDYKTYGKFYGCNWNRFRDENHLGVGDVCVVELINEMEKVLKVTIIRPC